MTLTHALARTMMAPIFVSGGIDAVRNPDEKAKLADPILRRIATATGLPGETRQIVRINGAVQIGAGSLLALGRAPRLASLALAVSLVPTTLAGHRYWEVADPTAKAAQRTELFKNLAMLGGLLIAATDADGSPSMRWRAKKVAGRAQSRVSHAAASATAALDHRGNATLGDFAEHLGRLAIEGGRAAAEGGGRAWDLGTSAAEAVSEKVTDGFAHASKSLANTASTITHALS